tara:strand:- start:19 stop:390 length:372 start_codon:yes stop_codon:yes gene_type:complete
MKPPSREEIVDGLEIGYAAINARSNGFKLSCIALYGVVIVYIYFFSTLFIVDGSVVTSLFGVVKSPDRLRRSISIGESSMINNANTYNITFELINDIGIAFGWIVWKISRKFNHRYQVVDEDS